jgi:hypothetical protein
MTELKDILRTEKNLHIKDGTKCLIVYEEQGKTYINKATLYNGGFCTNGVEALLSEDEVLDLVDRVGDYFNNFNLEGYTSGTLILTDPNPKGILKDKFSVRRFHHEDALDVDWYGRTLYRKPWTTFYKPSRGRDYCLSGRYEKYAIVDSNIIIQYILWRNAIMTGKNWMFNIDME